MNLTEEATSREIARRAKLTEADELQLRTVKLQSVFLPPNA